MTVRNFRFSALAVSAAVAVLAFPAAPVQAQRDPAYEAARASGKVGERTDGYLGIVDTADSGLRKLVDDINIKRRALYAQKAQAAKATLEEYAFTAGCLAIARTAPGEKYQAPGGAWTSRTSGPAERDSRCP